MNKNQDFLRRVRLYLYLIFGLGLFGCSVLKEGTSTDVRLRTYLISGDLLPGYEESCLISALDGTVVINVYRLPFTAGLKQFPGPFTLSVRVNDDAALQRVLERLQFYGLRVRNTSLQN
ncbi:MAG: hypothetical protein JWR50_4276 [Mucilaginibacter sp.]|nr:hypothetical protein [Mucilaginibacter sp.]